ncbi:hypothetical protein BXZ70DRAFT_901726 [Cristinia sonorae]|uniref:glutathione transferase n=1 Tax=Cristinia sonorae TaxID=1940300 RepID=A0A8K0UET1_9AGAR|nr:hypothetical protein BXZ70DRAFT_901726 [Cristinia sonorae]
MVLKLFGSILSPSLQLVFVICEELNISYELHPVDLRDRTLLHSESHLQYQPFAQVPYLIDTLGPSDSDVLVLHESRAMAKYVAVKYGGERGKRLVPDWTDLVRMAKFEEGGSVEQNYWTPAALGIAYEFWKPLIWDTPGDEAVKEKHIALLHKRLDSIERILSKQKYMGGDARILELTLVDFSYLPLGRTLTVSFGLNVFDVPSRPHVAKWWEEISSLPSWKAVVAMM